MSEMIDLQLSGNSVLAAKSTSDILLVLWTLEAETYHHSIGLTLIPVWIRNNTQNEITYPFPNFNGSTVVV